MATKTTLAQPYEFYLPALERLSDVARPVRSVFATANLTDAEIGRLTRSTLVEKARARVLRYLTDVLEAVRP